jgi:hypothetical protein
MNIENIMVTERNQAQITTFYKKSLYRKSRIGKFIKTESILATEGAKELAT